MAPCDDTYNDLNIYTKELGDDILLDGSDIARSNYIEKIRNLYNTMNKQIQDFANCKYINNNLSKIVWAIIIGGGLIICFIFYFFTPRNKNIRYL